MKNDLTLAIGQLKKEVDFLRSSMNECIEDLDFDGAKWFKTSLGHTMQKLHILQTLQNPNRDQIRHLNYDITLLEDKLRKDITKKTAYFDPSRKIKIEALRAEIDKLESITPTQKNDDDKILELLEELENNSISAIELELLKNEITLSLQQHGKTISMTLVSKHQSSINNNVSNPKMLYGKMAFDNVTNSKTVNNRTHQDRLKILEILSILMFEVFNFKGKETINIIVSN